MGAHRSRQSRLRVVVVMVASAGTLAAFVPLPTATATTGRTPRVRITATTASTATVFKVVAEGMTQREGDELARRAGTPDALRSDGSFGYRSTDFAHVPTTAVGEGRDEDGNATTTEAIDAAAVARITTLSAREARARADDLQLVEKPYTASATVGNTTLQQIDVNGRQTVNKHLDTTVSYQLLLSGRPVLGPGAKTSVSFAGDGSVLQLTKATRRVQSAGRVSIMSPEEAQRQCTTLYAGAEQNTPTLAYYSPPLAADQASGTGSAQLVTPQYVCQPVNDSSDAVSARTGRLVPAAPSLQPSVSAHADFDGRTMTARASVSGGTAPYTYQWTSSSASISAGTDSSVSYRPAPRGRRVETLTLTVFDANGAGAVLALTPSKRPGAAGSDDATSTPGGAGGSFEDSGIEQTVDEWGCAQASADGFRQAMQSHSQQVDFDWRGLNAFERDFRDTSKGGDDSNVVDDVDIQWYTGHGGPNGFSFKNTTNNDASITPTDASWGDRDLEWLNLESCQVLQDTTGTADFLRRWGPTINGLHQLNGFDTFAACVPGGTGGRFANYLFPQSYLLWNRPALRVSQAWGSMASEVEPAGTKWVSMSVIGPGGASDLNDYYWHQGTTGPDLTYSHRVGMAALSGIA